MNGWMHSTISSSRSVKRARERERESCSISLRMQRATCSDRPSYCSRTPRPYKSFIFFFQKCTSLQFVVIVLDCPRCATWPSCKVCRFMDDDWCSSSSSSSSSSSCFLFSPLMDWWWTADVRLSPNVLLVFPFESFEWRGTTMLWWYKKDNQLHR